MEVKAKSDDLEAMLMENPGRTASYLAYRAIEIFKDESKAYPPTEKHKEMKALLDSLEPEEALDDTAAKEQLHVFLDERLKECLPADEPAGDRGRQTTLAESIPDVAITHAQEAADNLHKHRVSFQF